MRQDGSVLYVSHTGSWGGGAESVLADVMRAAGSMGCAVYLAGPPGSLHQRLSELTDRCYILRMPWLRRSNNPVLVVALMLQWLMATARILGVLVRARPQAVHANSGVAALLCAGPCVLARCPLIWHQHDIVPRRRINRLVLGTCSRACSSIVATSRAVRASLLDIGVDEGKVSVIHPCVGNLYLQERRDRGECRDSLGLPRDGVIVTVIGRLVPRKGQALFLQAFEGLARRHPDARALVAGRTPVEAGFTMEYETELRRMSEAPSLRGKVTFLGEVIDSRAVLAASDVLVVPSSGEPFGIVIIEAFASGVPVVAGAAGGPLDIVENGVTGLLVPPEDVGALEGAILRLLGDPSLRLSLTQQAEVRVREQWTFARLRRQVQALYESLGVGAPARSAINVRPVE